MLTIDLAEEIERRLEDVVRATGRSASSHAEQAITDHLGDLEDYDAAEREVEEVRAGRSVPIPLDESLKAHGSAD